MSRIRRSTLTLVTSTFLSVVIMVVGLIAGRLLVRWLGEKTLGTFTVANGWLGQLAILEIGLAGAIPSVLARALARGDETAIRAGLIAAFAAYRRIAGMCLLGALILILAITRLMPVPAGQVVDLRVGMTLSAVAFLLMPLAPLRFLVDAAQRGYVLHIVLTVQSLLITSLSLLFACKGWGITGQFIAGLAGTLLFSVSMLLDSRQRLRGIGRLLFQRADPAVSAELRQLNRPTLICGISGRVGLLTDNLLIGYFLGPAAVVPFLFTQKLCSIVQGQLMSVGNSTWAALAELHVQGHRDLFARRLVQLTQLVMTLGLAAIAPVIAYNRAFFELWQPRLVFAGQTLTVLASINAVVLAVLALWGWVFSGTGRIARLVPVAVTGTIVNVIVSIVATKYGLIYGPVLGSTIGLVGVQLWWMPLELHKEFAVRPERLLTAIVRPLLVALLYAPLVWWAAHTWPPHNWLTLPLEMSMAGTGYLLLAYCLVLDADERRNWNRRLLLAARWRGRAPAETNIAPMPFVPAAIQQPVVSPAEMTVRPDEQSSEQN